MAINFDVVSWPPAISSRQNPITCSSVSGTPSISASTSTLRMSSAGLRAPGDAQLVGEHRDVHRALGRRRWRHRVARLAGEEVVGPVAGVVVTIGRDAEHGADDRRGQQGRELAHDVELRPTRRASRAGCSSTRATRGSSSAMRRGVNRRAMSLRICVCSGGSISIIDFSAASVCSIATPPVDV